MILFAFWSLIKSSEQDALAVGIDLGTTFTSVGVMDSTGIESFEIIEIDGDKKSMPSVIRYGESVNKETKEVSYHPIVGWNAVYRNNNDPDPHNYAYAFKRLMGINTPQEYKKLVEGNKDAVSYKLEYNYEKNEGREKGFSIIMKVGDKTFPVPPIMASTFVLQKVKSRVDSLYPNRTKKYCITYPAYFSENQVDATKKAASAAGIEVDKFLHEPVAAATAYQRTMNVTDESSRYLVFDFGGGTLDITLVDYGDQLLEAGAYSGSAFLGGENVTLALYDNFKVQMEGEKDFGSRRDLRLLRNFCEQFKIGICEKQLEEEKKNGKKVNAVYSDDFYYGENKKKTFKMDNETFNKVCMGVFNKVRDCVDGPNGILKKATHGSETIEKLKKSIEKVVFVGGSTRIPYIRKFMGEIFGENKLFFDLNPDTAIAEGATYHIANALQYFGDYTLTTVDTVPLSIGIRVKQNTFEKIIFAGQPLPYTNKKTFTTTAHNQKFVSIDVSQGDRPAFNDNHSIGKFTFELAGDMPAGQPEIEVTMKLSKDRTLIVTALEKHSGKEISTTFKSSDVSLSSDVIERMKREIEKNREKDEEFAEKENAIAAFEGYMREVESLLKSPNISSEDRMGLEKALAASRMWLKSEEKTADKQAIIEQHENLRVKVEPLLKGVAGGMPYSQESPKDVIREEL